MDVNRQLLSIDFNCRISMVIAVVFIRISVAGTSQPDCQLAKDPGQICGDQEEAGGRQAFFFSARLGACQPFLYHGCGGNSNRFATAGECKSACASQGKRSKHAQWTHADRCNATHLIPDGKYVECNAITVACPDSHICLTDGICCPSKDYVCRLSDDSGTFAEGIDDLPRFAWSADIKSCRRFSYYGARGNYNNFPSFRKCVDFCKNL